MLADVLEDTTVGANTALATNSSRSSESPTSQRLASSINLLEATSATSNSTKSITETAARLTGTESSITATQPAQSSASVASVSRPHGPDRQARIAIGVAVPVFMILISVILVLWIKLRKRHNQQPSRSDETTRMSSQPYLQRKGELEAEERARHELNADPSIHELEDTRIHEVSTGEEIARVHDGREIYELRGDEKSIKLEHHKNDEVSS